MGFVKPFMIMSWTVNFIGEAPKVAEALTAQSEKLTGASKEEYDEALPHLIGLVRQSFGEPNPIVSITANGHGHTNSTNPYRQCQVEIKILYGVIV